MGLVPKVEKIIAALYHIMVFAEKSGVAIAQYDLVKTIFLADQHHLNNWGRPITFDNYVAMEYGPVPSLSYDFLKENKKKIRAYNVAELPWNHESFSLHDRKKYFKPIPNSIDVDDFLSKSDIESLEFASSLIFNLTFDQIYRMTHEDKAYIEAWESRGNSNVKDMKFQLLFENPNEEKAKERYEALMEEAAYA